ncbi:MAG TPA: MFS transporter [Rhodobacteraceae bacterium]|mgnify:FL=1|jgi:MFS family permease|nr:MFS transporter [Paracoccaceae bacterium]HBR64133.1 MFS transporter [Paracoccaceae bacterium]|tara:strand:- start:3315 stop:4553 length:1239 start_codon:yes stop_codon:yes gene_type:complete
MTSRIALLTPVLMVGCVIIAISFGIRSSFGIFQIPISQDFSWLRSEYSMAIAIQNLAWGFGQPVFGAIADKFGDRRAIFGGALVYAAGLILSSSAVTPAAHQFYSVLIGFGVAGTGFGVILAVVGRSSTDANRSMSLAIATAAGSVGQIFGPPLAEYLLAVFSWQMVFVYFAVVMVSAMMMLPLMRGSKAAQKATADRSMRQILSQAIRDPSYIMIFIGFFSCGYQLAFITAHFPAFVTEMCGPILSTGLLYSMGITTTSALGAVAISLIGLTNLVGTLLAGWLGNRYSKKYLLAGIYTARTIILVAFILTPITPETVVLFSAMMGSLWLATVPLTSGLIAHIYGIRFMGTLYGLVFFSHQVGAFFGVWLGGRMYDLYGDYTAVWWIGIGVGALSALVHLPIQETRPQAAPV